MHLGTTAFAVTLGMLSQCGVALAQAPVSVTISVSATIEGGSGALTWGAGATLQCGTPEEDEPPRYWTSPASTVSVGGFSNAPILATPDGGTHPIAMGSVGLFNGLLMTGSTPTYEEQGITFFISCSVQGRNLGTIQHAGHLSVNNTLGYQYADDNCNLIQTVPAPDVLTVSMPGAPVRFFDIATDNVIQVNPGFGVQSVAVPELGYGSVTLAGSVEVFQLEAGLAHLNQTDPAWGDLPINPKCPLPVPLGCLPFKWSGCYATTLTNGVRVLLNDDTITPPDVTQLLGFSAYGYGNDILTNQEFTIKNATLKVETQGQGEPITLIQNNIKAGQATVVKLPSGTANLDGDNDPSRAHFVLAYGLKPGTPAGTPPNPDNIVVSDPYITDDDNGLMTLRQVINYWSSKNSSISFTAEEWLSSTPKVRDKHTQTLVATTKANRDTLLRRIIFSGTKSGVNGTIGASPQRDTSINPGDVCFIVTDLSTGTRFFSREDIAMQWYTMNPVERVGRDPFFSPPSYVLDLIYLIRLLNDPGYYDFRSRRDYYDPSFDRTDLLVERPEVTEWFGDGPPPDRDDSGEFSLALPIAITDTSIRLEAIAPTECAIQLEYIASSAGVPVSGPISAIVPGQADAPLGVVLGEFVVGGVRRTAFECAGDVNGDGATNIADFNLLATNFSSGPGAMRGLGDVTGDGFINVADFNLLAYHFGCTPSS